MRILMNIRIYSILRVIIITSRLSLEKADCFALRRNIICAMNYLNCFKFPAVKIGQVY